MIPDLNAELPSPNPTWTNLSGLAIKLKGAILMGHSESGFFPEQAALINPEEIKGLITIESRVPRAHRGADFQPWRKFRRWLSSAITSTTSRAYPNMWRERFDGCAKFVEQVKAAGGDATMMHLPKYGQFGNSHMLMQDKNNLQVADLILKWIDEHVDSKEKHANGKS